MNEKEKIDAIKTIFEAWEDTATPDTMLVDVGWDSMAMMGFIALLKTRFDKQLNIPDLKQVTTIGDLLKLLP